MAIHPIPPGDQLAIAVAKACGIPWETMCRLRLDVAIGELPKIITTHHVFDAGELHVETQHWAPVDDF